MLRRFSVFAILILLSAFAANAQTNRPAVKQENPQPERFPRDDKQEVSLPDEMRIKMAIARAEIEHKKVLDDVEKLGDLSNELAKDYAERKQISPDDKKKLDTIEKLARRVLSHAGGDEVDEKPGALELLPLADAIDKLNTAAETIRKGVKAETRFVVSATVIANSNEVINLARYIRRTK